MTPLLADCFAGSAIVVGQHTADARPSTELGKLRRQEAMSYFQILFQASAPSASQNFHIYHNESLAFNDNSITGIDFTVTADLRVGVAGHPDAGKIKVHATIHTYSTVELYCGRRFSESGCCCAVWSSLWARQSHLPRGKCFRVHEHFLSKGMCYLQIWLLCTRSLRHAPSHFHPA